MIKLVGSIVTLTLLFSLVSGQSCEGRCFENQDPSESCQCNVQCQNFGDCCNDYEELCINTCEGKCDDDYDPNLPCQCNDRCAEFGNCCGDYDELCISSGSCAGRCGDNLDPSLPCQCNEQCTQFGDCCEDYDELCGSSGSITDEDLRNIGETLWAQDINRMPNDGYTIDQNGPLFFTYVDESHLDSVDTFAGYLSLLDNYNANVGESEGSCSSCDTEENLFLDAIMQTTVIQRTWEFLSEKGLAADTLDGFRAELDQYWFGDYSRRSGGAVDSSGFEHVMVGELDDSSVSGFHNWIHFYTAERDGQLQFEQLTGNCEPDYIKAAFDWRGNYKSGGSMFLATSPEMDIAIYTICFLARPNRNCQTSFNGQSISIQTYDMPNADFLAIGTAYVNCN